MKIVMVSNTYIPIVGGVERSITSFTEAFRKRGHEVLIVTLEFDDMPEHKEGVVRVPAIRHFNGSDFSVRLPIPSNLTKVLDAFKPDIIHSHHPFILGDTALRMANRYHTPIVFTYHTRYEDYTHYVPLNSLAMKRFVIELTSGYAELVDQVIAPSESIRQLLHEREVSTPIEVIPTGVDADRFAQGDGAGFRRAHGIDLNAFVVGHVGRFAPEKNLAFLVRAVIPFLRTVDTARFLLVGKGPSLSEIEHLFEQAGLSDRLIYAGVLQQQDLVDAYHAMDVFAFASVTETQGMVILEAMAAALPVVAVDASGVRDVLSDKRTGFMVAADDRQAFTAALKKVYEQSDKQRSAFQQRAREQAEELSIEHMAERMLQQYEQVLNKDFVYSDIEHSPWLQAMDRIATEWDLLSNLADAVGSAIKGGLRPAPRKKRFQRIRRWLNNNEWTLRVAGLSRSENTALSPGLVMIQIDGLGFHHLKQAMKNGRMPFVRKLIRKKQYKTGPFYSGQPSSTPGCQAELFYGVKSAIPSFSFVDKPTGEVFKMYNKEAAETIEQRLQQSHAGLLEGGSSYANIYSGGAGETHFCAVDLGWDTLWRRIKPLRIVLIGSFHLLSIIRTMFRLVAELVLSCIDFLDGLRKGESFIKELKFIPTRLGICILLRDLVVFGAKIDVIRGLRVVHVNFSGYDEHAHRRGPSSAFAHWTLRGIDRCIARILTEAQRSQRRKYEVWIYSDHGQEEVLSYMHEHKTTVHQAVEKIFDRFMSQETCRSQGGQRGIQSHRAQYLGPWLFNKISPFIPQERSFPSSQELTITAMGPMGHVYVPCELNEEEKDTFARRLVGEAHIPLVFAVNEHGRVRVWNANGMFYLPDDAAAVFGEAHPYLREIAQDMIRCCTHASAGVFTIAGWSPQVKAWSFPEERGAHGGPGIGESTGFILLPAWSYDTFVHASGTIRPTDLRKAVFRFLKTHKPVNLN